MLEMSSADLIGRIFCTISKAECCYTQEQTNYWELTMAKTV